MRLLIVTTDFPPGIGGIATLSFEQARGLSGLGHTVQVLTTSQGAAASSGQGFEIVEKRTKMPPIMRLAALCWFVAAASRQFKPDFIWCPNYRGFGVPAMIVARLTGVPFGIYFHGTEVLSENRSRLRRLILSWVIKHSILVCSNSKNTGSLLEKLYAVTATPVTPGVHLQAMPSAPDVKRKILRDSWFNQRPSQCADSDRLVFIACCRICPEKGIRIVLESIALLDDSVRKKLLFVAVGPGSWIPYFKDFARQINVAEHVLFAGSVSCEKIPHMLSAADVYLQPSQPDGDFLESFGISFLEAQAVGLPCIATAWGGIPESVRESVTAMLIPPFSAAAVAEAITRVVSDKEWRASASVAGPVWASQNTWAQHVKAMDALLSR